MPPGKRSGSHALGEATAGGSRSRPPLAGRCYLFAQVFVVATAFVLSTSPRMDVSS
jgi:hypothetical protein